MIPEIVSAAADVAVAVENGVAMRHSKQAPHDPPPAPPGGATTFSFSFSGDAVLIGAAILLLALAMVAGALIVRNGLMA
jgi:hypothetical protein